MGGVTDKPDRDAGGVVKQVGEQGAGGGVVWREDGPEGNNSGAEGEVGIN